MEVGFSWHPDRNLILIGFNQQVYQAIVMVYQYWSYSHRLGLLLASINTIHHLCITTTFSSTKGDMSLQANVHKYQLDPYCKAGFLTKPNGEHHQGNYLVGHIALTNRFTQCHASLTISLCTSPWQPVWWQNSYYQPIDLFWSGHVTIIGRTPTSITNSNIRDGYLYCGALIHLSIWILTMTFPLSWPDPGDSNRAQLVLSELSLSSLISVTIPLNPCSDRHISIYHHHDVRITWVYIRKHCCKNIIWKSNLAWVDCEHLVRIPWVVGT